MEMKKLKSNSIIGKYINYSIKLYDNTLNMKKKKILGFKIEYL